VLEPNCFPAWRKSHVVAEGNADGPGNEVVVIACWTTVRPVRALEKARRLWRQSRPGNATHAVITPGLAYPI